MALQEKFIFSNLFSTKTQTHVTFFILVYSWYQRLFPRKQSALISVKFLHKCAPVSVATCLRIFFLLFKSSCNILMKFTSLTKPAQKKEFLTVSWYVSYILDMLLALDQILRNAPTLFYPQYLKVAVKPRCTLFKLDSVT